jgi:hypothetical protein
MLAGRDERTHTVVKLCDEMALGGCRGQLNAVEPSLAKHRSDWFLSDESEESDHQRKHFASSLLSSKCDNIQ